MFDVHAIKNAFGRAAPDYDSAAQIQQEVREQAVILARSCWEKDSRILDVGSGTGALAQEVAQQKLGWNVTGLDISFGMCRVAGTQGSQAVNASGDAMPFDDGAFDGIFSSLMLQWANDPLETLREMARVTRIGGRCVISTLTHGTLRELRESFAMIDDMPHVNQFMEPFQLSALAVHAGFTMLSADEEIITEHYPNTVVLMRGLKAIGASNKLLGRRKGLMTPSSLGRLERNYAEQFGDKNGLVATWRILYMILER